MGSNRKGSLFTGKAKPSEANSLPPWKILIIDDERDVHTVTKLALSRFKLDGHGLEFINAYSAEQAKTLLLENDDIAMAFVDVVMETDHAGLELVRWIREELQNQAIRLVLRTGQPGQAPEEDVIVNYDINDYKAKSELDARRLLTCVYTSIRAYRDIIEIEKARKAQIQHREGLERVLSASSGLFEFRTLHKFAEGLLSQVASLLNIDTQTLFLRCSSFDAVVLAPNEISFDVLAGTGRYSGVNSDVIPDDINEMMKEAIASEKCIYRDDCMLGYFPTQRGWVNLLYLDGVGNISELNRKLIDILAVNVGIAFENLMLNKEVESTQSELIMRLGDVVESRSKEAANHVKRMSEYCFELGLLAGMTEAEAQFLRRAAPMHDIGKIAIPDDILLKQGKLDEEEWEIMKQHPEIGHQILGDSERPILKVAAQISLEHHEKYDGSGYPNKLKGDDISLYARIVAIADVFDALTHARCYKEAWPMNEVIDEMKKGAGTHFDPFLLALFMENINTFVAIKDQWRDI
ncbi:DUF3369 domain-containing protein [Shewanella submarina]|uniref:DUF3369 domain-containing protein n=1 Tax=Shewanella submarina TaxID=2016376 RepID=A0ABV7GHE0_9GAMM|nr:DUF3369 domain-containing protein [Shewanella submarina]MCL1038059.1 DUF3369 domain-containing protein [Shewanella submarina]